MPLLVGCGGSRKIRIENTRKTRTFVYISVATLFLSFTSEKGQLNHANCIIETANVSCDANVFPWDEKQFCLHV